MMQEQFKYFRPAKDAADNVHLYDINNAVVHDHDCRPIMVTNAFLEKQALRRATVNGQWRRVPMAEFESHIKSVEHMAVEQPQVDRDPILNFIHNEAVKLRPKTLVMNDLKWKYLVRSAVRGKNIMMTGPAGCGKTMAAKQLVKALDRPDFYFNLGATQDPRGTLIGNTHFKKDEGTAFCESVFVKAIQTKDAVILLDELSRAHPEAWNILMTVLDQGQRYLRLDEHPDAPTIPVADGVTFIATANIGNEYTATRSMDRALVDRFIIIEMDQLTQQEEADLLLQLHPNLPHMAAANIAEIAAMTRKEVRLESPRISTSISTRISVELAGLLEDGFTLAEAAEVCIYPFFDEEGGVDSERTFIKQVVQKYAAATEDENIFNVADNNPF